MRRWPSTSSRLSRAPFSAGWAPDYGSDIGPQELGQRADCQALAIGHRGERDVLVELHRLAHRSAEAHLFELASLVDIGEHGTDRLYPDRFIFGRQIAFSHRLQDSI